MKPLICLLGFMTSALWAAGHADAQDADGPGVRSVKIVRPQYPQAARDAGHQGTVRLSATILPDGSLSGAKIVESSGSELLDAAAIAAFGQWQFQPPLDAKGRPRSVPFDYELPFYKLPLINTAGALAKFECRDFVADVSWFEATFPNKPRQDVRDYQALLAPILAQALSAPAGPSLDATLAGGRAVKAKRAALDAALVTCKAAPDMLLVDAIMMAEGVGTAG